MSVLAFLNSNCGLVSKLSLSQESTTTANKPNRKTLFIIFTTNQIYEMGMEIPKPANLEQQVFNIPGEKEFEAAALDIYRFQYASNFLYRDYCDAVRKGPEKVRLLSEIPFLPISFFKTHRIETTAFDPELLFKSS